MNVEPKQPITFAEFELDAAHRRLVREGKPVRLKAKAFDVLVFLAGNAGRVVSKEEILNAVWNGQFVEEANLAVQISNLRKALNDNKDNPRFLVTVPGKGYEFIADIHDDLDEVIVETYRTGRVSIIEEIETENGSDAGEPEGAIKGHHFIERKTEFQTAQEPALATNVKTQTVFGSQRKLVWIAALAGLLLFGATGFEVYRWRSNKSAEPASIWNQVKIKRLTNTGKIANVAALSPDGKLFAYSQLDGERQSLWLGHVDGGEPVEIRPPAEMRYLSLKFAPDGSALYYTLSENLGPGDLYRLPVFGGTPEKIKENVRNSITFAPDGKRFAYVRGGGTSGDTALVITDLENRDEREIGAPPTKLGFVWHSPAWSPDGSTIALGASVNNYGTSYEVFTVNTMDGTTKPLTAHDWNRVEAMTWLRDGGGLIVVATDKDSDLPQLWNVSYPQGAVRRIVTDLNIYGYSVGLSADNQSLLVVQVQTQSNIWVAPAEDLSAAKQITFGSLGRNAGWNGLAWTPDGQIVYTAVEDTKPTIWIMGSDGSGQRVLIPSSSTNFHPSVTNDGRYLVFQSTRGGKFDVWRAKLDGSDMRQVTDDDIAAQPDVSPDGKWVVYVSSREGLGTPYRVSIDGGEPVRLSDKRAEWLRISPDSRFVACGFEHNGKKKLAILPIEGGEPLKMFDVPRLHNFRFGIRWTPDGQAITYRDWANGIWKQNLEGGRPERLTGLPSEKLFAYSWSHDGKSFAFSRGGEIRDVVILSATE